MKPEFTQEENKILQLLIEVHNLYVDLPIQHPNDMQEWVSSIHGLEHKIIIRLFRKEFPDYFHKFLPLPEDRIFNTYGDFFKNYYTEHPGSRIHTMLYTYFYNRWNIRLNNSMIFDFFVRYVKQMDMLEFSKQKGVGELTLMDMHKIRNSFIKYRNIYLG